MSLLEARSVIAFTAGAGVAVACFAAGSSVAAPLPPAPEPTSASSAPVATEPVSRAAPLVTAACADKRTGVIAIKATRHRRCTRQEKAVRFAPLPPDSVLAPDGSLTLVGNARITSTNGLYALVVSDTGVGFRGPGGQVFVDANSPRTVARSIVGGAP